MLVRTANEEGPDQTASSDTVCLELFTRQLVVKFKSVYIRVWTGWGGGGGLVFTIH